MSKAVEAPTEGNAQVPGDAESFNAHIQKITIDPDKGTMVVTLEIAPPKPSRVDHLLFKLRQKCLLTGLLWESQLSLE